MNKFSKCFIVLVIVILILPSYTFAKKSDPSPSPTQTVSGSIIDKDTHEDLSGAYLYFEELHKGVFSGADGKFNMNGIAPGKYNVTVKFISYHDKQVSLTVEKAKQNFTRILMEPVQP